MSDFLLAAGVAVDVEDVTERLRWTPQMQSWSGQVGSLTWIITRVDDDTHWGPGWDPVSRTRVLVVGRFAFEEDEWQQAEKTPYQGGLAARLILSRWLDGGEQPIENLNGAGLALIIDEIRGELHLWTDRIFYTGDCLHQFHEPLYSQVSNKSQGDRDQKSGRFGQVLTDSSVSHRIGCFELAGSGFCPDSCGAIIAMV